MAILSGNRKILSSYFLLLNLSSMVKFSHNKAVTVSYDQPYSSLSYCLPNSML